MVQADIEASIESAIRQGLAEEGLFDTGQHYVLAELDIGGRYRFRWFPSSKTISAIDIVIRQHYRPRLVS